MAGEANGAFRLVAPRVKRHRSEQRESRADPAVDCNGIEAAGAGAETRFAQLGLRRWLCRNALNMDIRTPTKVQKACIPPILAGKDVLGCSGTGSGKTAAFALPVLQRLGENPSALACLVLEPARELALQVAGQLRALGAGMNLDCAEIVGGSDFQSQAVQLKRLPHVVVATPGRLHEHLRTHELLSSALKNTEVLVLDEADRLLADSFEQELRYVVACMQPKRQTMLFSATMTESISQLHSMIMRKAAQYIESEQEGASNQLPPRLTQMYSLVPASIKEAYIAYIVSNLSLYNATTCLVFARTCKSVQIIAETLAELGIASVPLHSVLPQKHRHNSLQRFKAGTVSTLIATDVAARGLDLPEVGLVVNHDVPKAPKDYVHRVGRTARNNRRGTAITLVAQKEIEKIKAVEAEVGTKLEEAGIKEDDALNRLGRIFAARRAATMRVSEPDGFQARLDKHKERKKARREKQEVNQG